MMYLDILSLQHILNATKQDLHCSVIHKISTIYQYFTNLNLSLIADSDFTELFFSIDK